MRRQILSCFFTKSLQKHYTAKIMEQGEKDRNQSRKTADERKCVIDFWNLHPNCSFIDIIFAVGRKEREE